MTGRVLEGDTRDGSCILTAILHFLIAVFCILCRMHQKLNVELSAD